MKPFITLLLIAIFFQIWTPTLLAQEGADTTFPTIENNPNIDIDRLEDLDAEPEDIKPKKAKKAATVGESKSFFTNIIQGFVIGFITILAWALYKKWKNKEPETIHED